MDYYKMENANHYTYLIGEDKDGSPVHNYCIGSNGIVEVQWASMVCCFLFQGFQNYGKGTLHTFL